MKILRTLLNWFINLFRTRYKVTVSFDRVYGNDDDQSYIAKRILIQKEKHLKFVDEYGKVVNFRGSAGLNYIIQDWELGD